MREIGGIMLVPMGTLMAWEQQKRGLVQRTGTKAFTVRAELMEALKVYGDKVALVNYQCGRVLAAHTAVSVALDGWPDGAQYPGPEVLEPFMSASTDLRHDLCFEFVAVKIAYDALARAISRLVPQETHDAFLGEKQKEDENPQIPLTNYTAWLGWFKKHQSDAAGVQTVADALVRGKESYYRLNDLRNEFIHRSGDTLIFEKRSGEVAFRMSGGPASAGLSPVKPTLLGFIKSHFEVAFEIEAWALAEEKPHVAGSLLGVDPSVCEFYRSGEIATFGVEEYLLDGPPTT